MNKIYDHYYSSSDAIIYLRNPLTDMTVHLDKIVGISYSHSISSVPIYSLGNIEPIFFTRGNSLVQGYLDFAFKSDKYLKTALNYCLKEASGNEREKLLKKAADRKATLTQEEALLLRSYKSSSSLNLETSSLSEIKTLFDLEIELNNENSTMPGEGKQSIKLTGIKFTSESMIVHSSESNALVHRYSFIGKNKY